MKTLILLAVILGTNLANAAEHPNIGTVGGPFVGSCEILKDKVSIIDSFSFDTKPTEKVGTLLAEGVGPNYGTYFVQVINDSYNDKLSVAVIYGRPVVENPRTICARIGSYNNCDFIKPRWSLPLSGPNTTPRFSRLEGTLDILDPDGLAYHMASKVDSYELKIDPSNSSVSDRISLKIDKDKELKCSVNYINLF